MRLPWPTHWPGQRLVRRLKVIRQADAIRAEPHRCLATDLTCVAALRVWVHGASLIWRQGRAGTGQQIPPGGRLGRTAHLTSNTEKCSYQFPKWFGCVLANHESLSGGLIGAGGALFAAWIAWRAVMDQIESDKELAREAQRAFVHGGPGGRTKKNGVEMGIVFSGQNTGKTPAFTRKIYWGVCKRTEWSTLSDNWIGKAKEGVWEEVLPPEMKPSERYAVDFTDTPIPRDEENYICFGAIVYTTVFGDEFTTSWKHRVVREGNVLKTYALSGGYSSEWKKERRRTA